MAKQNTTVTRKDFLAELAELAKALRNTIEAECSGFTADAAASAARRKQAFENFRFFRRTYFPHYIKGEDSTLHAWLDEALPKLVDGEREARLALAAPRGEAKSTVVSLIFVLWCLLTNRKKYIVMLADTGDQAAINLESIKAELEANPRLAMDFPEGTGQGRVWNVAVILTASNAKVEVFGATKKVRGRRHGPHRPDMAIGDDLENDENVENPGQRDKLQRWLEKSVLSLGGPGAKFDVFIIGTILHHDAVLTRLLNNRAWHRKSFRAIIEWPDRMDLWGQWEEILLNASDDPEEAEAVARAFYDKNRTAMDAGAVVSWPSVRPLYSLMLKRTRDGHEAFESEQQNDPLDKASAPFSDCITYWVNRLPEWVFFAACDPSLGKRGNGRDPSAILIGGLQRQTSVLDVVEADIKKRLPDRIIEDVIAWQTEYRCILWVVESVQFQEFFRTTLMQRAAKQGIPIPARGVTPSTDKALRIESLQPYVSQGRIRLHASQKVLIEQLTHFPKAAHDDGPDALHMLWEAATRGFGSIAFTPVPKGGGSSWNSSGDRSW